ncbi:MAG: CDP-alcohol phosphatidyltransferase family protein [Planctomycetes bacterium]|nr:CDP-alcohol phosphatidyltransferase family protein [Planctomycetota bacterium]
MRIALIPNLITVGNAVCGFAAVALVCQANAVLPVGGEVNRLKLAAWLILLGMVFDVFDGKIARLTKSASHIGAQLDSLSDLVTFGAAPAALILKMHALSAHPAQSGTLPQSGNRWEWLVWCLTTAYFLGALLRLARFTVESDHEESGHVCFKGLPSPGAAGVVAALVIFYYYLREFRQPELLLLKPLVDKVVVIQWAEAIPRALPILAMLIGYAMVSGRLVYPHMGTRLLGRLRSKEQFVYMVFAIVLLAAIPEIALVAVFVGYALAPPLRALRQRLLSHRAAESPR